MFGHNLCMGLCQEYQQFLFGRSRLFLCMSSSLALAHLPGLPSLYRKAWALTLNLLAFE